MNYSNNSVHRRDAEDAKKNEFLPLDFVVSSVERWGRLGGGEEKADHPPFVPPIKGGIILIRGIAEDIILTQER